MARTEWQIYETLLAEANKEAAKEGGAIVSRQTRAVLVVVSGELAKLERSLAIITDAIIGQEKVGDRD